MKLLTVSHFYEAHGGGIERVAAHLCRDLASLGHTVLWAASDAEPVPFDIEGIPLRCFDPAERMTGLPMPIPGLREVHSLFRAIRTSDAIIVHDALYATSILAVFFAKISGKPIVLIQHIAAIPFASRTMRALMHFANVIVTRQMLASAERLIFISDHVRRELIGEPARRGFRLLFNGVDAAIFHPSGASPSATRAKFQLPEEGTLALFVGRFVEKKGLAVLRALAIQRPDLQFALVGTGPIQPESWGLRNVHVFGSLPQAKVAALYRAADFLLVPSVGEGYPLVIQEAMACGLPVVCGADSARGDPDAASFLNGVEINLADPDSSAARCTAAIDRLEDRPLDRTQMSEYARNAYSWSSMARELMSYLSSPADALDAAASRKKLA